MKSLKYLAAAITAAVICASANAQSVMTRSQLETQANQTIHANGVGGITGPILNSILLNIIASEVTQADTSNMLNGLGIGASNDLLISATAPTFTSGACVGAIGATNGTAAFTFTTGSGSCGSTATIGLPTATTGWICDAFDEAEAGTARIQETSDTASSVVFTNYSIGTSPAALAFTASHTVKVKCAAY